MIVNRTLLLKVRPTEHILSMVCSWIRAQIVISAILLSCWVSGALKILYRNLQRPDLTAAGDLSARCFDFNTASFTSELEQRFDQLVIGGFKHAMVVAVDETSQAIVGFVEVGTLPSPVPVRKEWQGNIIEEYPESPYMGNVCVDPDFRRQSNSR
jgi:ribosomal protein S18 acetylase RimI-like enzyme